MFDIQNYKIDTFVMGDDWEGKFDFLKGLCDVVYLPRTEGVSSTQTKKTSGNINYKFFKQVLIFL